MSRFRHLALAALLVAACGGEDTGTVRVAAECEGSACGVAGELFAAVGPPSDYESLALSASTDVDLEEGETYEIEITDVPVGDWRTIVFVDLDADGAPSEGDVVPAEDTPVTVDEDGQTVSVSVLLDRLHEP